MREIKFRAWTGDQMINPYTVLVEQGYFYSEYEEDDTKPMQSVMQYIGIKDKNDTEIYEADLMKLGKRIHVVEWSGNGYALRDIRTNKRSTNASPIRTFRKNEVIGNIHSTPELLLISKK